MTKTQNTILTVYYYRANHLFYILCSRRHILGYQWCSLQQNKCLIWNKIISPPSLHSFHLFKANILNCLCKILIFNVILYFNVWLSNSLRYSSDSFEDVILFIYFCFIQIIVQCFCRGKKVPDGGSTVLPSHKIMMLGGPLLRCNYLRMGCLCL